MLTPVPGGPKENQMAFHREMACANMLVAQQIYGICEAVTARASVDSEQRAEREIVQTLH